MAVRRSDGQPDGQPDSCVPPSQQQQQNGPWAHVYGPHTLALVHYEPDNITMRAAVTKWLDGMHSSTVCVAVAGDLPRVLMAVLQHQAVTHVHALQVWRNMTALQVVKCCDLVAHPDGFYCTGGARAAHAVGGTCSTTCPPVLHGRRPIASSRICSRPVHNTCRIDATMAPPTVHGKHNKSPFKSWVLSILCEFPWQ